MRQSAGVDACTEGKAKGNLTTTRSEERSHSMRARRQLERVGLSASSIERFLHAAVKVDLHVKTVLSLSLATLGVLHSVSLCIHVIGRGMAWARDGSPKHATKQVDRLLSNNNVSPWFLFDAWVRFVVGPREELLVALDWTEFDVDDHATLALHLITRHGRATPLIWRTVKKSSLAGKRNDYEDEVIERLHEILPKATRVTLLADRGFGDQERYAHLGNLGWDYIIRFRECIIVTDADDTARPAGEWLTSTGRAKMLKNVRVTQDKTAIAAVVLVHDKRMKEPWCLATSRADLTASQVTKLYGRRFCIEKTFRDVKNVHFGMGLSATHIGDTARRDRLLLIAAFAHVLLTLLGEAGERAGLDRLLKTNTVKHRTLSLYNQGCYWYTAIPNMREERLVQLMTAYGEVLREHAVTREILGTI
ncbi:transposase [Sorangium cellulosum]|uniref:Transposase n=2 Tax=Sorangium cellulosum TaxID=56 RepID=A0A4P2QBQ4_SORCE|nr:transposase [Sorangium cellulosum]